MRKLSTNAFLVFSGDIGARLLGFLASAHLARSLEREGFGIVVIGLSFLSYVLWFADLGLGTLGTREMGKPPEHRVHLPGEIFTTRLLLAALVILPALAIALLLYRSDPVRWVVCGYIACTIPYALLLEWYYQGTGRLKPIAISRVLTAAVYLAGVWFVVAGPSDVVVVPALYFASMLAPALFLLAMKRGSDPLRPGFSLRRSIAIIRQSSMIGVGGVFAQSVQLLPPLLLGYYSMADTGLLGAALRVAAVMLVVDRVFAILYLPTLSRLWSEDRRRAEMNVERALTIVIAGGFALGTLVTINAPAVMTLIFSESYRDGAGVLAVLSWFATITLINSVFSLALIAIGREREYLRATVTGGIVSALLSAGMIHLWGLHGAAVAMVASEICMTALAWLEFRRHIRSSFMRPLLVALSVSAASIVAARGLEFGATWEGALWQVPVVAAIFIGLTLLLGGLNRNDIAWLMRR